MTRWWWRVEKKQAEMNGKTAAKAREEAEQKVNETKAKGNEVRETINRSEKVRAAFFTEEIRRALGGSGR